MFRRSIAAAASTLVVSLGVAGAAYADKGVGPSPGTTGQDRACQVHSGNNGMSNGHGLQCTFLTLSNESVSGSGCSFTVTGGGLDPGSQLTVHISPPPETFTIGPPVPSSGGVSFNVSFGPVEGHPSVYVTGTTAAGSPITSNAITCS